MKNKDFDIHTASGIIVVERKVLMIREKDEEMFISPGGKIKHGEFPKDTLVRELLEELNIVVNTDDLDEFGVFYAEAVYNPGRWLRMEAFNVHSWKGVPTPNNGEEDIEEILWVNSKKPSNIKIGSIFEHEVIPRLKKLDLID